MGNYYADRLSAERLRRCYEIAPPRARAYLEAEIEYVFERTPPGAMVLELGCGYGRVLQPLLERAGILIGIDTSRQSLAMAAENLGDRPHLHLVAMDAAAMGFAAARFDVVICIQNGISAFAAEQRALVAEAVRVTRRGGTVFFASYADSFWDDRLAWFEKQAAHGLIGAIDREATGAGVIVCRDGFRATTVGAADFRDLTRELAAHVFITEVAESSLFCVITPL